jgi:DNA-nicking Smr family endonuclease|tara:strand:+ start:425 stop:1141 length:717 start_codon:yes stop_codon:yes gene_type:complete
MKDNKAGLADLKKLHKEIQAGEQPNHVQPPLPIGQSQRSANQQVTPSELPGEALTPEDQALFRRAVRMVKPLKPLNTTLLLPHAKEDSEILKRKRQSASGAPLERMSQRLSDHYLPARPHLDAGSYLKPGMGPDVIKNLKRQKWPITASLDLHGATLDQARNRLEQFLQSCITHQLKCVRVVHGKGYGSRDATPVLKDTVRRWLMQFNAVLAYIECNEQNGGAGAVQILLEKPKRLQP